MVGWGLARGRLAWVGAGVAARRGCQRSLEGLRAHGRGVTAGIRRTGNGGAIAWRVMGSRCYYCGNLASNGWVAAMGLRTMSGLPLRSLALSWGNQDVAHNLKNDDYE